MKNNIQLSIIFIFILIVIYGCSGSSTDSDCKLKCAFEDKFLIGALVRTSQVEGDDYMIYKILKNHINSITAENCMKAEVIHPEEGKFDFYESDIFVDYGLKNKMFMVGHALVWHTQTPDWYFEDSVGNNVTREVLIKRMRNHIQTIVGRYKGRINGWEVVNEAILNDGNFRENKYFEIIGEDYIRLAYQFAHDADPKAELYYNDNRMDLEPKRNTVVKLIKDLKSAGVRLDGVGMECHLSMDEPSLQELEKSIIAISECGVKVMISELDMTVLPQYKDDSIPQGNLNPYVDGLPDSISKAWNERMFEFYKLFIKHSDKISRVTTFGISDNYSWRNNWPIVGRKDYPLLFDRDYQPKPVVNAIIEESRKAKSNLITP